MSFLRAGISAIALQQPIFVPLNVLQDALASVNLSAVNVSDHHVEIGQLSMVLEPRLMATTAGPAPTCEQACASLATCTAGGQSSYCKKANDPNTCFGLYWRAAEAGKVVCFAGDADCPQTDPVICDDSEHIIL